MTTWKAVTIFTTVLAVAGFASAGYPPFSGSFEANPRDLTETKDLVPLGTVDGVGVGNDVIVDTWVAAGSFTDVGADGATDEGSFFGDDTWSIFQIDAVTGGEFGVYTPSPSKELVGVFFGADYKWMRFNTVAGKVKSVDILLDGGEYLVWLQDAGQFDPKGQGTGGRTAASTYKTIGVKADGVTPADGVDLVMGFEAAGVDLTTPGNSPGDVTDTTLPGGAVNGVTFDMWAHFTFFTSWDPLNIAALPKPTSGTTWTFADMAPDGTSPGDPTWNEGLDTDTLANPGTGPHDLRVEIDFSGNDGVGWPGPAGPAGTFDLDSDDPIKGYATPVPSAMILGMMGLGIVGYLKRRRTAAAK